MFIRLKRKHNQDNINVLNKKVSIFKRMLFFALNYHKQNSFNLSNVLMLKSFLSRFRYAIKFTRYFIYLYTTNFHKIIGNVWLVENYTIINILIGPLKKLWSHFQHIEQMIKQSHTKNNLIAASNVSNFAIFLFDWLQIKPVRFCLVQFKMSKEFLRKADRYFQANQITK